MSEATILAGKVVRAKVNRPTSLPLLSIAGTIDDGSDPLEGVRVTVELNGVELAEEYTDASGNYSFPAGLQGSTVYQVYADLSGYTPDEDPLQVPVASSNVTDADFTLTEV